MSNDLKHRIQTDIKFLYPCITYVESQVGNSLIIEAETRLGSLRSVKVRVEGLTYYGTNYFGRDCFFKEISIRRDSTEKQKVFYCIEDGQLFFLGNDTENDPSHPVQTKIEYSCSDMDDIADYYKNFVSKVKNYISKIENVELVNSSYSVGKSKEDDNRLKLIIKYEFEIKNGSFEDAA